ncbi:PDZ domain-containing protein [Patescibacteria group bacterium]|nr:PDZ domain-containing protein [Patescibacteria group bacterium]MBP7842247.1 PDZ domain-containing protein [Patescibacteria group bacterium]
MYVTEVYADSIAQKAGLEAGDVIFSINDIMITPDVTFLSQWLYVKPGDSITFKILRNGDYTSTTLTLPQKQ